MTTFFLDGGYGEKIGGEAYQQQLAKFVDEPILYLGFALPDLKRRREKMTDLFTHSARFTNKPFNYIISSETADKLAAELKQHSIWVIGGGLAKTYVKIFKQIFNLDQLLQNKIIFGSSAGAVMWAHWFYETDRDKLEPGLGIIPYNILVHYGPKYHSIKTNLEQQDPHHPILLLPEQHFHKYQLNK